MSEQDITLTSLFHKAGAAMRIYDLGRRIRALGDDEFERIETLSTPYPTPYLHHAWIALVLWNPKAKEQNAVWFLKLPLDEQGFMLTAVRDDLINRLLTNVQQSVDGVPTEDSLKENPFSFKPSDEKMAVFHALAGLDQKQTASAFYEPVQQFIKDPSLTTGWENLSLQGLTDFVLRLDHEENERALIANFETLPEGLAAQLFTLLEHTTPSKALSQKLLSEIKSGLESNVEPIKLSLLLRAISCSSETIDTSIAIESVLNSYAGTNAEVLAAVATRCENALLEPRTLKLFLEKLAQGEAGQAGFSRTLADLMYLPVHRILIVQALRSSDNSPELINATQQMFGAAFQN